jgi:hypothetical protein
VRNPFRADILDKAACPANTLRRTPRCTANDHGPPDAPPNSRFGVPVGWRVGYHGAMSGALRSGCGQVSVNVPCLALRVFANHFPIASFANASAHGRVPCTSPFVREIYSAEAPSGSGTSSLHSHRPCPGFSSLIEYLTPS